VCVVLNPIVLAELCSSNSSKSEHQEQDAENIADAIFHCSSGSLVRVLRPWDEICAKELVLAYPPLSARTELQLLDDPIAVQHIDPTRLNFAWIISKWETLRDRWARSLAKAAASSPVGKSTSFDAAMSDEEFHSFADFLLLDEVLEPQDRVTDQDEVALRTLVRALHLPSRAVYVYQMHGMLGQRLGKNFAKNKRGALGDAIITSVCLASRHLPLIRIVSEEEAIVNAMRLCGAKEHALYPREYAEELALIAP
jgi:hypothetical protein